MFAAQSLFHQSLTAWSGPRRVLFLQGNTSPFWAELGRELANRGVEVHKIHFCLSDVVFWRGRRAKAYRGTLADWPVYLEEYLRAHEITDVIYYADQLPYHRAAHDLCVKLDIPTWAMELGYLRPDWITLEPGGTGAFSTFATENVDLDLRASLGHLPKGPQRFDHPFWQEAASEVAFGLLIAAGRPVFRSYVSDRVFWPVFDYLSWIPKLAAAPFRSAQAARAQARLLAHRGGYTLVAMQVESDYQIRKSSPYGSLVDFLDEAMESFARTAPKDRRLAIKLHPMDSGLEAWFPKTRALARKHGLLGRVDVFRGGDLGQLLRHAQGVVTVNSTVGVHALRAEIPVFAAGVAVYDRPGLTHQASLDHFWHAPEPVDPVARDAFLKALTTIQVRGSFYDPEGRKAAVAEIANRLMNPNWCNLTEFDKTASVSRQREAAQEEQAKAEHQRIGDLYVAALVEGVNAGSGLPDDMQDGVEPQDLGQPARQPLEHEEHP